MTEVSRSREVKSRQMNNDLNSRDLLEIRFDENRDSFSFVEIFFSKSQYTLRLLEFSFHEN